MRFIWISVFCFMLASCASNSTPTADNFGMAYKAMEKQDWESAYRFLEDKLISENQSEKDNAITTIQNNSKILDGAVHSFSYDLIKFSMMNYGDEKGIELEKKRLEMFKVVASRIQIESAKSNIDRAALKINTEAPKKDETLFEELSIAKKKSVILCKTKKDCEKLFSLTQIFVSSAADMKIQLATDTIIETYNPTSITSVGIKAIKSPRKGDAHEISLFVLCADDKGASYAREFCMKKSIAIYKKFPSFISDNLAQ